MMSARTRTRRRSAASRFFVLSSSILLVFLCWWVASADAAANASGDSRREQCPVTDKLDKLLGLEIQRTTCASENRGDERNAISSEEQSATRVLDFTQTAGSGGNGTGEQLYNNFIVTFRQYKYVHEHRVLLEEELNGQLASSSEKASWKWVDRENIAVDFPTDFGVISLAEKSATSAFLSTLRGLESVRNVFEDKTIRRDLKSLPRYEVPFDISDQIGEDEVLVKGPGRLHTRFSFDDGPENATDAGTFRKKSRRQLSFSSQNQLNQMYRPESIWKKGYRGQGIRVGIFDTGVREDHPDLRNIRLRTNWTFQQTLSDGLGHGSFVAGCIASVNPNCPAVAPEAELYTFKVFTDAQESFTSWYLDALNYAMIVKLNIINVSIGGPDYTDTPFIEKFKEAVANNVIVFVAMGNDGPNWGTANNPGDEMFAIGVGGHGSSKQIANFQVRGMTIQEAPYGYGRVKPDIVAFGEQVSSLRMERGCRVMSGTSVASPVAAGLGTLLGSTVPVNERYKKLTPASMKQVLIEGANRIPHESIYVQGPGTANLLRSFELLQRYEPRVSVFPKRIDMSDEEYMWPHTRTPLYASGMPLMLNLTVINGLGATGYFKEAPKWIPSNALGTLLSFQFEFSEVLWPWNGYLALFMHAKEAARYQSGFARGTVTFRIHSPPFPGESMGREQEVKVPVSVKVIPTPERSMRILWDDYHNIQYPPHYVPIDDLSYRGEILDWNGDHPHTNFHPVFNFLTDNGFFVEILSSSMTCFNASNYGTLVLCDTEGEFHKEEITKLHSDVTEKGLGLLVLAEWYSRARMRKLRFFDDNTRSIWTPIVGGSNVPGLNRLLSPFGVSFTEQVVTGNLALRGLKVDVRSGTSIATFPAHSNIFDLTNGNQEPVLGMASVGEGNILVFGDTSPFDTNVDGRLLPDIFLDFVMYTSRISDPTWYDSSNTRDSPFEGTEPASKELGLDSFTLGLLKRPLKCFRNGPLMNDNSKAGARPTDPLIPNGTARVTRKEKASEATAGSMDAAQPGEIAININSQNEANMMVFEEDEDIAAAPRVKYNFKTRVVDSRGNSGIFRIYFQRQISVVIFVFVCIALVLIWKSIKGSRRSKVRATKNRYARLRQIV